MKKLYIGNLPFSTTDADLRAAFEPFGQVQSASVVIDRETGRSRGFGFVEMANDNEAATAIEKMNGAPGGGGRGGFGGGGGGRGGFGGGRGGGGGGFGGGRGGGW